MSKQTSGKEQTMKRMQPQTDGEWAKVARKHYRHMDGVEVIYRHNEWLWEIVGGGRDGERYERLWAAQHAAVTR